MDEPTYLDLAAWPRRETFEYFRHYARPHFGVCTRVDVAPLKAWLAARDGVSLAVACHWLALRGALQVEAFRYRIEGPRVRVHGRVGASTVVLRDDDSIGFATLPWCEHFDTFARQARTAIDAARRPQPMNPLDDDASLLHFTTLPWVHFTAFTHARGGAPDDSTPKFAFGRCDAEGARLWMPLGIEVHHALMDGLHVGRFVQGFEEALADPAAVFGGG